MKNNILIDHSNPNKKQKKVKINTSIKDMMTILENELKGNQKIMHIDIKKPAKS